jgi:hypothetical protein
VNYLGLPLRNVSLISGSWGEMIHLGSWTFERWNCPLSIHFGKINLSENTFLHLPCPRYFAINNFSLNFVMIYCLRIILFNRNLCNSIEKEELLWRGL